MTKRLIGLAAVLILGSFLTSEVKAAWVNGWWVYPYSYFQTQTFHSRPMTSADQGVCVNDRRIYHVPMNEKGIALGATTNPDGSVLNYRWIAIWHCEISDVHRSGPGIHCDFIQICGGGNMQRWPTSVLIQDVHMHDGEGIPLMLEDGWFDNITLKDIRYSNTTVGMQISTIHTGRIGTITIDHCPNMGIAIMGRPGSIGTVYIKNSPGARINDVRNAAGLSGCKIVYLN